MPYGEPSHRVLEDDPGADARLTMCEYAAGVDARFAVSSLEIDRGGPVYTIDTLRELRARSDVDEVFLLLGGDQAAALGSWRSPAEVLSLAVVAVAERDEWRQASILDRLRGVADADRLRFFEMPRIEISSSMVRRRARAGQPIRYLVPDKVANYVGAQSLYGASAPARAASGPGAEAASGSGAEATGAEAASGSGAEATGAEAA